jgi:hypothetical protein
VADEAEVVDAVNISVSVLILSLDTAQN